MKEVPNLSIAHDRYDGRDHGAAGDGSGEHVRHLRLTGREDTLLDVQERTMGKRRVRWEQRVENLLSVRIEEDEG
jgi:hypothetical protein